MTITVEPIALSYDGDDSTVDFAITWKYFAKSDVLVTHRDASGVETPWVLDTDYTLTAAGVESGGTLTATTAPATNETLVIELDPPNTQDSSLPLGGEFPSTVVESELDQSVQRDVKIERLHQRAIRVPTTDTQQGDDLNLPIDSVRASKFLAFDGVGKPIAAAGTSADLTPVSAYINTLLDDADEATARATLGVAGTDAIQDFRLIKSGANLTLERAAGNYININGTARQITGSLPTLAATALSVDTNYFIYAYWTGSAVALEASATAYTVDASGRAEKSGDASRRLLGLARTVTGPAWQDDTDARYVISYNHRKEKNCISEYTGLRQTASNSFVEVNSEIRNLFLSWDDEIVISHANGAWEYDTDAINHYVSIGFDGATAEETSAQIEGDTPTLGIHYPFSVHINKSGLSESNHYSTLVARTNDGGATALISFLGGASQGERTSLHTVIKG